MSELKVSQNHIASPQRVYALKVQNITETTCLNARLQKSSIN